MAAAALIAHRRAPGRAALRPIKTRCRTQSRSGRTPHGADLRSSDHHSCCPCLDLLPRCLAWRAASLCRRQLTRVAERHPELVSDIRPKFPEDVETHACCEGIATCPQGGSKTAFVPRMVGIVESDSGHSSQPLRNVEHVLAAVALRYKGVLDRMDEALPAAAVDEAVVSRILREDCWIREISEKPPRCLPGEVGAKAFPISLGALSERGVPVGCLIQSCVEGGLKK